MFNFVILKKILKIWALSTAILHKISNIQTIKERSHDLNSKYLSRYILMENPIITNLFEEYKNYINGINIENTTPSFTTN